MKELKLLDASEPLVISVCLILYLMHAARLLLHLLPSVEDCIGCFRLNRLSGFRCTGSCGVLIRKDFPATFVILLGIPGDCDVIWSAAQQVAETLHIGPHLAAETTGHTIAACDNALWSAQGPHCELSIQEAEGTSLPVQ